MSTSLYQYMDIKKIIIIAIFALNIISIHAENDRIKLLMDSNLSLNQAVASYFPIGVYTYTNLSNRYGYCKNQRGLRRMFMFSRWHRY